jgi:Domain of unknown function (DUF4850)
MRHRHPLAALTSITIVLCVLFGSPAFAGDAVQTLTGPPIRFVSKEGVDFRHVPARASDTSGRPIADMPASRILIKDTEGGWETAEKAAPAFKGNIPVSMRGKLQLIYVESLDWLVVPRGWQVRRTAMGVDGTSAFSFVAPTGTANGWMTLYNIPACLGCIYDSADAFFPDVHAKRLALSGEVSTSAISPKPETMTRPDRCTVLMRYRLPGSPPIHDAVIYTDDGDPTFDDISVALADADSDLAEFLVAYYRHGRESCGGS